jgi:hypothetical protein
MNQLHLLEMTLGNNELSHSGDQLISLEREAEASINNL